MAHVVIRKRRVGRTFSGPHTIFLRAEMKSNTAGYVLTLLAISIFAAQDGISKHLVSAYPRSS